MFIVLQTVAPQKVANCGVGARRRPDWVCPSWQEGNGNNITLNGVVLIPRNFGDYLFY